MSHISHVKTKITNKKILLNALNDLGYKYEERDFQMSGFGGRKSTAQIRVLLPWSSDIGLRERNGTYEIIADWWGVRGIDKDTFVSKLLRQYAYRATLETLQEKGFTLASEEKSEDGQIHLVLRRLA